MRPQDLDFPGVTPSRQKRSRETTSALLKAGAEMLRTHSLAELSIEALCREVGATVGAFYSRFESKEAYFNVLIELAARDGGRTLTQIPSTAKLKEIDLARLCFALVRGTIGWMRDHEGVLRAALQHGDTKRPGTWRPFKRLAGGATLRATPLLLSAMGKGRKPAKTRAIAFAFQVMFGTLVNAILNDPGPLSLHDPEMETRLGVCFLQLLQTEMTTAPAGSDQAHSKSSHRSNRATGAG
jgi:AcrR family transcriptional regulator